MGCELYFKLTLIKKDISSLFAVFKARLKRGTADTRPGQLKDLLLRQSIFHKPLQEPALSDTSPISIIHYRGTDSGAYICVCVWMWEWRKCCLCSRCCTVSFFIISGPFSLSLAPANEVKRRTINICQLVLCPHRAKKSQRITQTDFQFSLCNKQMH